jgi:hypothetical protein
MKKTALFLVLFLVINTTANAFLPVIVWAVARQAAVFTAQTVAIGVIAKGFSANDPYVRTTATISRSRLAQNMATSLRGSRWAGLAALTAGLAGLGWFYDEEIGLHTVKTDFPRNGFCASPGPGPTSAEECFEAGIKQKGYGSSWVMVESRVTTVDCGNMPNACPRTVKSVSLCANRLDPLGDCSSSTIAIYRFYEDSTFRKIPVPASEIEAKGLPQLAASPNTFGDMFAGANPDMLNKLLDGATIPYNATNPTPEMAQLKSDYRNGLLQALDPAAPHYVTLEQLKQIQDLVAAEDAANTDEGTIEALNEKMKQPITQAQYEETNKKYSDAVDAVTNTLPNNDADIESIDDSFNKLDGIITDIPNASLPSPAHIQLPHYTECMTLNLTDGKGRELVFPSSSQCDKINQMKSLIGYFLAGLVAMGLIWQLLTRPHG